MGGGGARSASPRRNYSGVLTTGGSPAPRAPPAWSAVALLAPWAVLRFTRRPMVRPSSAGGRAPAPAACGCRGLRVPLRRVGSLLIPRVFVGGLCVGSPPAAVAASRPLVGFGLRPCRRRRRRPPCGRAPPLRFGAGWLLCVLAPRAGLGGFPPSSKANPPPLAPAGRSSDTISLLRGSYPRPLPGGSAPRPLVCFSWFCRAPPVIFS